MNKQNKSQFYKYWYLGIICLLFFSNLGLNELSNSSSIQNLNNLNGQNLQYISEHQLKPSISSQNDSFSYPFFIKFNVSISNYSDSEELGKISFTINGYFHFEPGDEYIINSTISYKTYLNSSSTNLLDWDQCSIQNSSNKDSKGRLYEVNYQGEIKLNIINDQETINLPFSVKIFDDKMPIIDIPDETTNLIQYNLALNSEIEDNCNIYFSENSDDTSNPEFTNYYIFFGALGGLIILGILYAILRRKV